MIDWQNKFDLKELRDSQYIGNNANGKFDTFC